MVFFHKKSRALIWGAVALALVGLYLLCMTDDFGIGKGDILVLICSVLIFPPYSGDRSFFAESGWCENGVHPVLGLRGLFGCSGIFDRDDPDQRTFGSVGADPVCGCAFLRCGIYAPDHRTEKYEPDRRVFDPESGILHFGAGRLGDPRAETDRAGNIGLCLDVRCDRAGADAGKTARKLTDTDMQGQTGIRE